MVDLLTSQLIRWFENYRGASWNANSFPLGKIPQTMINFVACLGWEALEAVGEVLARGRALEYH